MKRKKGPSIGYTSGVFDMFHIGHLKLLRRAKSMCDRLIVGVTIDELVGYKGARVIVPFPERLEIVQNISCVDLAVPQDDLNKFQMWRKLKFDIMFIGDDWFATKRFNDFEKQLAEVGVRIIYLPYTRGVSSSRRKVQLGEMHLLNGKRVSGSRGHSKPGKPDSSD